MNQRILVELAISPSEYQQYYSGRVRAVVARALDGRTVRFPASVLTHVVGHDGVQGRFAIEFSSDGKFQGIERL